MIPWKSRYSATVILTVVMLVDGVMTLQSLDYWYQRVNGTVRIFPSHSSTASISITNTWRTVFRV